MSDSVRKYLVPAMAIFAAASVVDAAKLTDKSYQDLFVKFAQTNNRSYASDEFFERFQNFRDNVDFVVEHNEKPDQTFTVGLNQFADWSMDEFEAFLNSGLRVPEATEVAPENLAENVDPEMLSLDLEDLPAEVDWAEEGYVMAPRNQGSCGACYAFSALGAMEGRWGIARGKESMKYLSPQSIVDCDRTNGGCSGGFMTLVYRHLLKSRGGVACSEDSYPYAGRRKSCKTKCDDGAAMSTYVDLQGASEATIMKAVSQGPVAVGVQANSRAIMNYKAGIITGSCGSTLDHAVVLYGYGTDAATGTKYWKLRNSWSARWGEKGDFFVKRGGLCGIQKMPSYPVIPSLSEETVDYSNLFDAEQ